MSAIEARREELVEIVEQLPASSPAAKLTRAALLGLDRLEEILTPPITADMDVKEKRLAGDMAVAANKLLMQAAEGQFRQRRDDAVVELLERLALERAKDGSG